MIDLRRLSRGIGPTMRAALRTFWPWLAWCAVVFGALNTGASMAGANALKLELRSGVAVSPVHFVIRAWRIQFSDFGDTMRYAAYANATLGRPYQPYFVRSSQKWLDTWKASTEGAKLDLFDPQEPAVAPERALVPWRDFVVEYPPGFLPWVLLPALFTSSPTMFGVAFSVLMGAVLTAALALAQRLLAQLGGGPNDRARLVLLGAMLVLSLGVVSTYRFDPVASLAIVAALVAAFSDRPGLAGVALGVGAATKLVPALAALPLAIFFLHENRRGDLMRAGLAGAAAVAMVWLPAIVVAGHGALDLFRYHGERPLEIESTGGLLVGLLDWLGGGSPARHFYTHGSINVGGPWSDGMRQASRVVFLALTVATLALTWVRMARASGIQERRRLVVASTVALLCILMGCGAVFSPQYAAWLVPLGLVVALRTDRATAAALFGVCLLTQVVFPTLFGDLNRGDLVPLLVGFTRNGLLFWFAWRALVRPRRERTMYVMESDRTAVRSTL